MHICPVCGAPEGSKQFIGPFCITCYHFKIEIPDKIEVKRCKRCGRIKLKGEWIDFSEKRICEYVESKFKGEFSSVEFFLEEKKAVFVVEKEGSKIEIPKRINFTIIKDICPECNKRAGGYFEAIIQLRGNPIRVEKYARLFIEELEKAGTFVSKESAVKNGLDLYVGSTKAVFSVIKELGLTYKISTTLAGQKQGRRLYRSTFSIRL